MLTFFFITCLLAASVAGKKEYYRGHRLVSVQATTREQVEALAQLEHSDYTLDFWSEPSMVRSTSIRVPPQMLGRTMQAMRSAGMSPKIVNNDLQEIVNDEDAKQARRPKDVWLDSIFERYLTYDEAYSWLELVASRYPDIVELSIMGYTVEDRPIPQVKISSSPGVPKPAIWFDSVEHAREWVTLSTSLNIIYKLVENIDGYDMLKDFDVYVAPIVNPDGYSYTHTTARYWRKNRAKTRSKTCRSWGETWPAMGTDLNRNWDSHWGVTPGASSDPCSDTYYGEYAFSAIETAVLSDAMSKTENVAFISLHCFSNMILIPNGHTSTRPPDYDRLEIVALAAAGAINGTYGQNFRVGTPPDLLYVATGGAFDYAYDVLGIPWPYTFELRPASGSIEAFHLPEEQIREAVTETWAAITTIAQNIKSF